MKLIIAYIQPDRLNSVKQELYKRKIYKISASNALGCGQQMGYTETYRGVDIEVNLLKKLRSHNYEVRSTFLNFNVFYLYLL